MKKLTYERTVKVLYYCGRCDNQAFPRCMEHRHQIEIIRGNEINSLPIRKRYECNRCFKTGFTSVGYKPHRLECTFCKSANIRLI